MFDVIVPADLATTDGARHTVVETAETEPWTAHVDVLEDGFALAAVRAAIESRPLPCQSPTTVILGELLPPMITGLESGLTPVPLGRSVRRVLSGTSQGPSGPRSGESQGPSGP